MATTASRVREEARSAGQSPWVERAGRIGLVAKGTTRKAAAPTKAAGATKKTTRRNP